MKRHLIFLSAVTAIVMVSVTAYAQPRRGAGRGMMSRAMSMAMLLRNEAVQKEVGITDEQGAKIQEVMPSQRPGQRPNFQDMTEEERQKWRTDRRQTAEEQVKKVAEILDEKQMARLNEIRIQAMGPRALLDEEVAKKLGISEEVQDKIQAVIYETMSGGRPSDREAFTKAMDEVRAKVQGMLTDEQQEKFKEMVGKPFDTSQIMRGLGRRNRGN